MSRNKKRRFRPLIGVSFCKPKVSLKKSNNSSLDVFVPLSGLASVNDVDIEVEGLAASAGFRPLIGVSFCKL